MALSSRILLTDLLQKKVPRVSGILVLQAHQVEEGSMEDFCLRLIRRMFPTAFIRALSEHPEDFNGGFAKLKSTMQCLGVEVCHLLPRGDPRVKADLDASSPNVTELAQPMTASMLEIQAAIVEAWQGCLAEIKSNRASDFVLSSVNAESTLLHSYHRQLTARLQPYWHQVHPAVKVCFLPPSLYF